MQEVRDCHFMDKEACEDKTRESLISISYRVPEKDLSGLSLKNSEGKNLGEGINGEEAEQFRSNLISMSYPKTPKGKAPPVAPGDIKG